MTAYQIRLKRGNSIINPSFNTQNVVFMNMTEAFDSGWHKELLYKIKKNTIYLIKIE